MMERRLHVLPVVPRPEANETYSSWCARLAMTYGLSESAMERHLGLRLVDRTDPDFGLQRKELNRIASVLLLARRQLRILSSPMPAWRLLPNRRTAVCVACIQEDLEQGRHPYLRRPWVNAWQITCEKHQLPLVDATVWCSEEALGPREQLLALSRSAAEEPLPETIRLLLSERTNTRIPLRLAYRRTIEVEKALSAGISGQRYSPPGWPAMGACEILRVVSDLAFATNFEPVRSRPLMDLLLPRSYCGALFRISTRMQAPFFKAGVNALENNGDPAVRRTMLWCVSFLLSRQFEMPKQAHETAVPSPLKQRCTWFWTQLNEDGQAWLRARMARWPTPARQRLLLTATSRC